MEVSAVDILREMSLRHMRLTREKALVSIDPMARVMYVVSGAAPVHIRCFSLDLLFEPVEFTINTKSVVRRCSSSNSNDNNYDSCYFAPKKAYLTESRNHLVLVGSTQVVAFNVRDFLIDVRMHPRPEYPLKPCAQLMADTAICDTFPCADNVLVLTEGALLRLCLNRSGNSAANTAEELARFRFTPTSRPLKVWAKTSSAYWVLFSDSSIKIFLDRSQKVSSEKTEEEDGHIKLDAPAESFAVVPGVPDVLVTYSQQSKEFCCYYLLSDGPASYAPDEVVLFAQVEAHLSDVSLSLISRDVIVHSCTCFGRLRLARNPAGPAGALSPVYTPAVCARRLYISSVALLPEFNARCFVLGLSDGSVDLVEPGTELSPLETRVGSDSSADPALLDALVPPQKIVFDPKKEDPLLVAEETCEKIRVYADAVLRDSNERAEAIASACAENKDAVLAIGERIRRLGESIDRSAQRIADLVRRQSELEARYCDVPNQRVLEELYARLMRNKDEFTKRLEEYKRTKTASKHIMQDNN